MTRAERWRALLEEITPEDRSKFGPGVLMARVVWELGDELRRIRRVLSHELEGRGLEGPTIASDLGALARVADPLLDAVEDVAKSIDGLEGTIDRIRVMADPRAVG